MLLDRIKQLFRGDQYIWGAIFVLVAISFLSVYSSTSVLAYQKLGGNTTFYMARHLFMLLLGLGAIVVMSNIQPKFVSGLSEVLLIVGILGLAAALMMGNAINGSSRWIKIGGLTIQPSEFAKIALIIFIAKKLAINWENPRKALTPILIASGVVCGLILLENLSTCALVATTCGILMLIGRIPLRYLGGLSTVVIFAIVLIIFFAPYMGKIFPRANTWRARVERFVDDKEDPQSKAEDYQAQQALMAVATGGFTGKGPGNSYMKNFLPMAFSDFIFSIILEEYGLWGGIIVIICYITIMARSITIARRCDRPFHIYTVLGLSILITLQALINMSVGVGLIPVTGQTLPMVSMGGTSNVITGGALGIILSISALTEPKKARVEEKKTEEIEEEYIEEAEAIRF